MGRIKVAHMRKLEGMLAREEISYGRMVEMLNEIAETGEMPSIDDELNFIH